MSNQQHPPQQPDGQPPAQPQPQPPKKKRSKILGFGCLGTIAVLGFIGAAVGGGSSSNDKPAASAPKGKKHAADGKAKPAGQKKADDQKKTGTKPAKKIVTFKVWGTAPAGTLGPLDITYGSDSDNRKGDFNNGTFKATLPLHGDALYYNVTAQLQGSGDINCSVTVNGKTKKGHASGDYNICNAQLSAGLLGGWD